MISILVADTWHSTALCKPRGGKLRVIGERKEIVVERGKRERGVRRGREVGE
jgi:hypothetical protein